MKHTIASVRQEFAANSISMDEQADVLAAEIVNLRRFKEDEGLSLLRNAYVALNDIPRRKLRGMGDINDTYELARRIGQLLGREK